MANTVAVMVEYMDVLTEKYNLLHHQLLEARIMVDKNHIVIQRDKLPDKAVTKSRSVSLVSPPTSLPTVVRRASVASARLPNTAGKQVILLEPTCHLSYVLTLMPRSVPWSPALVRSSRRVWPQLQAGSGLRSEDLVLAISH